MILHSRRSKQLRTQFHHAWHYFRPSHRQAHFNISKNQFLCVLVPRQYCQNEGDYPTTDQIATDQPDPGMTESISIYMLDDNKLFWDSS